MKRALLLVALLGMTRLAAAAPTNTDGTVTFRVSTKTFSGSYSPKHVLAAWVTDGQSNFIKTIEKRAGTRQGYLYRWNAVRGGWTNVDGVSSATITSHQTHNMSWNCRTTNNVVVTDGYYRVFYEFTESNAQGKTNQYLFYKGSAASTSSPPDATYFTNMLVVFAPYAHNLAVSQLTPTSGFAGASIALQVRVTNLTASAESFRLVVSNLTLGAGVATQQVTGLAGLAATNVALTWNAAGLAAGVYQLKASAGPATGETSVADNELTVAVQLRTPQHDVALNRITVPAMVMPGTTSNVLVTASNAGDFAESFAVLLTDVTGGVGVRTATVSALAAAASTNVSLAWNTVGAAIGYHALLASAAAVTGETALANNSLGATSLVASALRTNVLLAKRSTWRYHDLGYDLTRSPWRATNFYDGAWAQGAAPFGYGSAVTTTNRYGADPTNRYLTYYYRSEFIADLPSMQLMGYLRRDDGAVVYLNGVQVLATNLPVGGSIDFTTRANVSVTGADETNHFAFRIDESLLRVGRNLVAVEMHQDGPAGTDLGFDLELRSVEALIPPVTGALAGVIFAPTNLLAGDFGVFQLVLTNSGNFTRSYQVLLVDTNTGAILAMRDVTQLPAGDALPIELSWNTGPADAGVHGLQVRVVAGTATSLVATLPPVSVTDGANAAPRVNLTGSVGGPVARLAVSGNLLLAGEGATLAVFDLLDPLQPVERGRLRLPGWIKDIVATGAYAYVACGEAGVHCVDLSDPAHPAVASTRETSGDARGLSLCDQHLYLADGAAGCRIFDVTSPTALVHAASVHTEGPADAVYAGELALNIVDQFHGLAVYDLPAPATPSLYANRGGMTAGRAVDMANWKAFTVDAGGRLCAFNVENTGGPEYATNLPGPAVGRALALAEGNLYIAAGDAGLQAFAIVSDVQPVHAATLALPGPAEDVAPRGGLAYVACGEAGLAVVSLAVPSSPALVRMVPGGARAFDAAVQGETLWLAGGEAGLQHWSISNAAAPHLLQVIANAGLPQALACDTGRVVAGDASATLRVFTPGATGSWQLAGSLPLADLQAPRALDLAGDRAAVTDGRRVVLVDIGLPAAPAELARRMLDGFLFDLALTTTRLYVASGSHLEIMAVPDLATLGTWEGTGVVCGVQDVAGQGTRVSLGAAGTALLDLSDPANPVVLQREDGEPAYAIRSAAGRTVTSDRGRALAVADTSVALTPVPVTRLAPLLRSLRLAQHGAFVLAAEGAAGLAVTDLAPDDHDQDGLSDAWERALCSADAGDALAGLADVNSGDDLDGDGTSNRDEFLAGTDARSAQSVFVVSAVQPAAGELSISWRSEAGLHYRVLAATQLAGPYTPIATGISATPPVNVLPLGASAAQQRFVIICTER